MAQEGTVPCNLLYIVRVLHLMSAYFRVCLSVGVGVCVGLCYLLKNRYKHFAFVPCLKRPAGEGRTQCSRGGCRRMHSGS